MVRRAGSELTRAFPAPVKVELGDFRVKWVYFCGKGPIARLMASSAAAMARSPIARRDPGMSAWHACHKGLPSTGKYHFIDLAGPVIWQFGSS